MIPFVYDYGLIAIILSALAAFYLPFCRRPAGYLALSAAVAAVVYRQAIFGYMLLILVLFTFARAVERLTTRTAATRLNRWSCACAGMLALLALFVAGSLHLLDPVEVRVFNTSWTLPSHDMWLLLRMVSFLWEFGSGRIKELSFVTYATWITLPVGLLGPLIRYAEFLPQYSRTTTAEKGCKVLNRAWSLKLGLAVTQMAIGAGLNRLSFLLGQSASHWPKLLIIFGTSPWGVYLETSGTFHLMECLAVFWTIELPPSFNKPFGQPNISEFWARWNMTIVRACRDYLFYNRWGFKKVNVYLNLVFVFLAVGLWHGFNWYWAAWGILHGLGFCVYLWYRTNKKQLAFVSQIGSSQTREIASRAGTYIFVCLAAYVANKIALVLLRWRLPHHLY